MAEDAEVRSQDPNHEQKSPFLSRPILPMYCLLDVWSSFADLVCVVFRVLCGGIVQRMAALKRAFADVILNTAKESAARILASERRVLQLQQSLSLAREESLDMLLRLKSIMDSKVMALSPISHSSTSVQFSLWQKIAFRGDFSSRYPVCTLICLLSQDELLKFGCYAPNIMLGHAVCWINSFCLSYKCGFHCFYFLMKRSIA